MTKLKKIFFVLLCTALFLTGCSEEAQDTDKPVQSENQTAETKKPADTEKKKPKKILQIILAFSSTFCYYTNVAEIE